MTDDASLREYRISRNTTAVRLDNDTLIWNDATQQLHRLNAPATLVWEALHNWSTSESVVEWFGHAGLVDASHVRRCVHELYDLGILECRTRRSNQTSSSSSGRD